MLDRRRALATLVVVVASFPCASPAQTVETVMDVQPTALPSLGPIDALVTIELFGDMSDTRTRQIYQGATKLQEKHPRRVRVIFQLTARRGRWGKQLESAYEAHRQGRFFDYVDALYLRKQTRRKFDPQHVFQTLGLDLPSLSHAYRDERSKIDVEKAYMRSRRYRLRSIPGLLINGQSYESRLVTVGTDEKLERAYRGALSAARDLIDQGVDRRHLYSELLRSYASTRPPPRLHYGRIDNTSETPKLQGLTVASVKGPGSRQRGANAPKVVVGFFCHLQSRNCSSMYEILRELEDSYPEMQLVFAPASGSLTEWKPVIKAHSEALCAGDQGRFWEFVTFEFRRGALRRRGSRDIKAIEKALLSSMDLNVTELSRCLESKTHEKAIKESLRLAKKSGIVALPAVTISGTVLWGTRSYDELRTIIDKELGPGLFEKAVPRKPFLD